MTKDQIKQASKALLEIDRLENRRDQIQSGMAIRATLNLPDEVIEAGERAMLSTIQDQIDKLKSDFEKL